MVDNNKIPFIGYELDNKLIFYDANEQKIIFREDSINNDIDKEKLS